MSNKQAIGIHVILRNKVGNFAKILSDLSGLYFVKDTDFINSKNISLFPSFHYRRYQNCVFGKKQKRENFFHFTANVTLENIDGKSEENEKGEIGAVVLSVPSLGTFRENSIEHRNEIIKAINKLLFNCSGDKLGKVKISTGEHICSYDIKNREFVNELLTKNCIFQVTNSVETYRAKIFNLYKNIDFYKTITKEENLKAEIERAYVDTTFSYKTEFYQGSPLAKLYLCCRHGNKPGALAAAINTLLFKKFGSSQSDTDKVFNITFLIDYLSFSPSVSYNDFYGNLEPAEKSRIRIGKDGDVKNAKEIIERIMICPITDTNKEYSSWTQYANNLWEFLGKTAYKAGKDEKQIFSNNNEIPQNLDKIFIYRKDRDRHPCEITKESRRCPNEGCDICRKYWR